MSRVYGIEPGPGVRSGMGYRFFTHTGEKLLCVTRVAFDGDADEGTAEVTGYAHAQGGTVLVDYAAGAPCRVTYRTWVRAVAPGRPDPPRTPGAVLYQMADGGLRRFDADPLPDEAAAAGGG